MKEWQLGLIAFQEGRMRETAERLRVATVDHERSISQSIIFQTYTYLGAALYSLGDASGAAEAFTNAIRLRIGDAIPTDLALNLANACIASGKKAEAESVLAQALRESPGAMEVRTLLERLRSWAGDQPLSGTVMGETPGSVKQFMRTLSFPTASRGFAPDQVNAAMTQISHYIDVLSAHLAERDQQIARNTAEIERLRQTEETLVENLVRSRQELDQAHRVAERGATDTNSYLASEEADAPDLTPLEKLFQKKN